MNETILSIQIPIGGSFSLFKNAWEGRAVFETLSIATGLHGDQVNGLHIASRLTRFLESVVEKREEDYRLLGKIQLLPAINVPALETGSRVWSFDGMDLDLAFPGNDAGDPTERICHTILRHTGESSCAVLLESSPRLYNCVPHVRILHPDRTMKKFARATLLNIGRVIKEHEIPKTQLTRYWTERGIPAFSILCGRADVYSPDYCDSIVQGLINLMCVMGVLGNQKQKSEKGTIEFHSLGDECQITANRAGLFEPEVRLGDRIGSGGLLGSIRDLRTGNLLEEIIAPEHGRVLALREHPLVYEKEPITVLVGEKKKSRLWPF
tara:strand:+ start:3671 stop:4639 length:969 start_codon:yes stop_codon:yes gene_type:complete